MRHSPLSISAYHYPFACFMGAWGLHNSLSRLWPAWRVSIKCCHSCTFPEQWANRYHFWWLYDTSLARPSTKWGVEPNSEDSILELSMKERLHMCSSWGPFSVTPALKSCLYCSLGGSCSHPWQLFLWQLCMCQFTHRHWDSVTIASWWEQFS